MDKCETRLGSYCFSRDREVGPADFLPAKKVADGINRLKLKIEIWFEMKFHCRLEQTNLGLVGDREDPDSDPGIPGGQLELLVSQKKNMKSCLQERVVKFVPRFVNGSFLIPTRFAPLSEKETDV
ncbi:MAG: hypothetical protein OXH06_19265 [Gemmatimonadetes bacterium]|nr:hypothetical protein [Gemmatimonadota bacterium]